MQMIHRFLPKAISPLIIASLITLLIWFRMDDVFVESIPMSGWGHKVLYAAIFMFLFGASFYTFTHKQQPRAKLTSEELAQKRQDRIKLIFLSIALFTSVSYVVINWQQLIKWGYVKSAASVALFFGLVYIILDCFNNVKWVPEKLTKLPYLFMIKVFIPMLPLLIIVLGAFNGLYKYQDTFLADSEKGLVWAGQIFSSVLFKCVTILYGLGRDHPRLWLGLVAGAIIILIYWTVKGLFQEDKNVA